MGLSDIKCFVCGGGMVAEDQTIDNSRVTIWLACAKKPKLPCLEVSLKVELDLRMVKGELHTAAGNEVILLDENFDYSGMIDGS